MADSQRSASPNTRARRWIAIGIAGLASAPSVVLAVVAFVSIVYSIATEQWYRSWFLGYGSKLAALYLVFSGGIAAAALLASGYAEQRGPWIRNTAIGLCVAGIAAALALELQFWDEADRFLPRGIFAGPFLVWAIVMSVLRKEAAVTPALRPEGPPGNGNSDGR